jgi:preprotein translocase subunit SecG
LEIQVCSPAGRCASDEIPLREESRVPIYLAIGQILIAVALVAAILLQVQGGGLGGIFGQSDGVYRTRRGIERTLFRLTIVLAVVFVVMAMLTVATS